MAFKDFMKTVKSETEDAIEITKLRSKTSKEKSNIKDNYEKIGKYIAENRESMGELPQEILDCLTAIDASKEAITANNNSINDIKMGGN